MKNLKNTIALGITIALLTSCGNSSKSNNLSSDEQTEVTSNEDISLIIGKYTTVDNLGVFHYINIERDGTYTMWIGNDSSPEVCRWTGTANNLILHTSFAEVFSSAEVTEKGLRFKDGGLFFLERFLQAK